MSEKITIKLATFPLRLNEMQIAIDSIYDQVDEIQVYLNGYDTIPKSLIRDKITTYITGDDLGDLGKFYRISEQSGYIFTIDDDIKYPSNYVKTMIQKIEQYKRQSLICVHGNKITHLMPGDIQSYYKNKKGLHFTRKLEADEIVDIPGTGTMAYHSHLLDIPIIDKSYKNMSDLWLARLAMDKKIPVISIKREDKWLQCISLKTACSIYIHAINNDLKQTEIAKSLLTMRSL